MRWYQLHKSNGEQDEDKSKEYPEEKLPANVSHKDKTQNPSSCKMNMNVDNKA